MKPTTSTQSGTFLNSYNEHLTYDKNGNIISLDRTGDLDSNNTVIFIDELYYLYDNNSNKLRQIDDYSNHPEGFTNAVDVTQEYDYDDFGNMTQDLNKGIDSITYNHLNLPKKITYSTSSQNISYLYNALGVKVQKKVYREGQTTPFNQPPYTITTDYLGGFHYEFHDNPNLIGNNGMVFFATSEGYVNVTTNRSVSYNYVYNYTDHLGNIRVSYTSGTGGAATILEENHYYPFGLKHKKYGSTVKNFVEIEDGDGYYVGVETVPPGARKTYQYKYQGQERQDELGLNWDSFKWRNYDFALGRFFNIDPLAEKYAYQSPYNFAENRVVDGNELEGLEWVDANGNKVYDPSANEGKGGYTEHATSTHKNLGKSLNQTPTGRGQFNVLVNSQHPVQTTLDNNSAPKDKDGSLILGQAKNYGIVVGTDLSTGLVEEATVKSSEIILFMKNIDKVDKATNDGDSSTSYSLYNTKIPEGMNFSKIIGAILGHEIEHTTIQNIITEANGGNYEKVPTEISDKIIEESR